VADLPAALRPDPVPTLAVPPERLRRPGQPVDAAPPVPLGRIDDDVEMGRGSGARRRPGTRPGTPAAAARTASRRPPPPGATPQQPASGRRRATSRPARRPPPDQSWTVARPAAQRARAGSGRGVAGPASGSPRPETRSATWRHRAGTGRSRGTAHEAAVDDVTPRRPVEETSSSLRGVTARRHHTPLPRRFALLSHMRPRVDHLASLVRAEQSARCRDPLQRSRRGRTSGRRRQPRRRAASSAAQ
jgi:hypothetical protein